MMQITIYVTPLSLCGHLAMMIAGIIGCAWFFISGHVENYQLLGISSALFASGGTMVGISLRTWLALALT